MAKTIEDYKKDYADAQARGDKAGMAAANNGANAIRQQQGQKVEVADVTKEVYGNNYVGSTSRPSSSRGQSGGSYGTTPGGTTQGGYTPPKKKTVYVKGKGAMNYWDYMTGGTDYSRRPDLAGKVLSQNGVNVWYDEDGYARKGLNADSKVFKGTDKSVYAPSIDRFNNTGVDRGSLGGSDYDQYYFSDADLSNAAFYRDQAKKGNISWEQANKYVEGIRSKYGYSGGSDGSGYNPLGYKVVNPDETSPDKYITAPFQGVEYTGSNYQWDKNISDGDKVLPVPTSAMRGGPQASTRRGNSAAGVGGFTDWQQDIIDRMNQNSNAWHGASQAEKDRLHAENEYLSGMLGGNVSFDKNSGTWKGVADFPPFYYGNAPEFTSRWDSIINDYADKILNRDPFEYNYLDDPNYQQYREAYTREGQRAMQDTIGEVSARTGGLASSYAASAANQANNYYMSALADKIPELRQMAYQAYLSGIQMQRDDLSMLMGLENMDYGKYMDSLGQWNADRSFNYGIWRDQVNDQRYEEQMDYNKRLAAAELMAGVGDFSGYASLWGLTEDQTKMLVSNYAQQKQTSDEQAARELASWYAQYGDFSKLKELGVDTSYLQFMQNMDYMKPVSGGSSGGSSGGRSSGGGGGTRGGGGSGVDIYQAMYDAGIRDEGKAYAYLVSMGYNTTQSGKFAGYYADWLKDKEKDSQPTSQKKPGQIGDGSWFYDIPNFIDKATGGSLFGGSSYGSDKGRPQLERELNIIDSSSNPSAVPEKALRIINKYYDEGLITEYTARELMKQYGF